MMTNKFQKLSDQALGKLHAIYISPEAGMPMTSLSNVQTIKGKGLAGDRYAKEIGFWQKVSKPRSTIRDVSLVNLNDIVHSGFTQAETRRNLVMTNEENLTVLIHKFFIIGEVLFQGIEECTPCKRPSDLSGKSHFAEVFKNCGGLRARVLSDGIIRLGDEIFEVSWSDS